MLVSNCCTYDRYIVLYTYTSPTLQVNIVHTLYSLQVILQADPDLVALHCQEIGGKDFELTMPRVKDFIR